MKNLISKRFYALFSVVLITIFVRCSGDKGTIRIYTDIANPMIEFAMGEIENSLSQRDYNFQISDSEAADKPLPKDETTPPVTNINDVMPEPALCL